MQNNDDLNIIYDHYKDTFEQQKHAINNRNKLFIAICILISLLCFFSIQPTEITVSMQNYLSHTYHFNININIYVLQSLSWFFLLYFTSRYYRASISIERKYNYLSKVEKYLVEKGSLPISRENQSYLENYPMLLDFIDFFYKWIFPVSLFFISLGKIISEYISQNNILNLVIDSALFICLTTISILYLIFLHPLKVRE